MYARRLEYIRCIYTRAHAAAIRPYVLGYGCVCGRVRGCVRAGRWWWRGPREEGRRAVGEGGGEKGSARNACAAINTREGRGRGGGEGGENAA